MHTKLTSDKHLTKQCHNTLSFCILFLPDIWVIGDSIPYWAGRRASVRHKPNLTLDQTIAWWGIRGMSWEDFTYSLQLDTLRRPPAIIAVHLGGNDMVSIRTEQLCRLIKEGFDFLRHAFPDTKFIWLDILPRLAWGRPEDENAALDRKRKRVNRWGRQQVSGRFLKIDIDIQTRGFFRADGIHLSDVGLDFYLDALKDFLETVIRA